MLVEGPAEFGVVFGVVIGVVFGAVFLAMVGFDFFGASLDEDALECDFDLLDVF